jgi:polyhydroxybutyrate depolymerase
MLLCAGITGYASGAEMKEQYISVGGEERGFYVYKPSSAKENAPVVFVLHGGLGNAEHMMRLTGMDSIAEENGFIVVYPEGTPGRFRFMRDKRTWNAGRCCGRAVKQDIDDVSFLSKLIDRVVSDYHADRSRVYMMGISNGAMMAYRFACERPEKVAAIVSIAGAMAVDKCDGIKDVAVLHIHGDRDQNVPVKGGTGKRSVAGVEHRSLKDTVKMVIAGRKCKVQHSSISNGKVEVTDYKCQEGMPVKIVVIKGATHTWPGANTKRNRENPANMIYSASKAGWNFLKQFSK